ncbi:Detected protein of unknown function [Hibiscus syriacus]|uniref:Uncharacterized protein n=1 Tax=Hibiscus syriacus TaxID=106335 RepID=A0A6A3BW30_HIBSY|nr:Detected protein of unknown function [Hibiscus syriacus]
MAESTKFHPALTIKNVKSLFPVTLDNKKALYHSWAALFTKLTRVHDLYDHIIPPIEELSRAVYLAAKSVDLAMWNILTLRFSSGYMIPFPLIFSLLFYDMMTQPREHEYGSKLYFRTIRLHE